MSSLFGLIFGLILTEVIGDLEQPKPEAQNVTNSTLNKEFVDETRRGTSLNLTILNNDSKLRIKRRSKVEITVKDLENFRRTADALLHRDDQDLRDGVLNHIANAHSNSQNIANNDPVTDSTNNAQNFENEVDWANMTDSLTNTQSLREADQDLRDDVNHAFDIGSSPQNLRNGNKKRTVYDHVKYPITRASKSSKDNENVLDGGKIPVKFPFLRKIRESSEVSQNVLDHIIKKISRDLRNMKEQENLSEEMVKPHILENRYENLPVYYRQNRHKRYTSESDEDFYGPKYEDVPTTAFFMSLPQEVQLDSYSKRTREELKDIEELKGIEDLIDFDTVSQRYENLPVYYAARDGQILQNLAGWSENGIPTDSLVGVFLKRDEDFMNKLIMFESNDANDD